jgi:hemolysin activation/secretion protein
MKRRKAHPIISTSWIQKRSRFAIAVSCLFPLAFLQADDYATEPEESIPQPSVYPNNLKNREFEKEAPQNFCSERASIADRQGASESENYETNLTQSKTDSSSCLGIEICRLNEAEKCNVTSPCLRGIIILGSLKKVSKHPDNITGVEVRGLKIPGEEGSLESVLIPLLDKTLTEHLISRIKRQISLYYHRYHRPVNTILVPEQDVTDGVVQLVVIESAVDQMTATGAHYFSNEKILSEVNLQTGDSIDTDNLMTDIAWLNQNPFRQTNVAFSPGSKPYTTDVQLITRDRRPYRVYLGGDNTGNEFTGYTRLFTGFNWGNVFNLDHLLSFQWTTSDDIKRFNSYTASYSAPLSWRHVLNVFGGYSKVKPDMNFHFKSKGWSAQGSLRYKIFLGKTYGPLLQDINAGYDFKWTNNNLEFVDETSEAVISTKVAQISQFLISYHLGYAAGRHALNFVLDYVFSPFQGWFRHHNKQAFNILQPGSYPIYMYVRGGIDELYTFSKYEWGIFFRARGQYSNKILLPSEQFGLGGYDTVRGYPERVVNYDDAACVNFELRAPPIRVFKRKKKDDALVFLAFIDYGWGTPHKVEHPRFRHIDPPSETLIGFGPGLRYFFNPYFSARADCGFPLTSLLNRPVMDPWFHFSLFASY